MKGHDSQNYRNGPGYPESMQLCVIHRFIMQAKASLCWDLFLGGRLHCREGKIFHDLRSHLFGLVSSPLIASMKEPVYE